MFECNARTKCVHGMCVCGWCALFESELCVNHFFNKNKEWLSIFGGICNLPDKESTDLFVNSHERYDRIYVRLHCAYLMAFL